MYDKPSYLYMDLLSLDIVSSQCQSVFLIVYFDKYNELSDAKINKMKPKFDPIKALSGL